MNRVKEGDLFKIIELYGRVFELKYGYYEEYEKDRGEPIPIYPNFRKNPVYTDKGQPFVTQMQELCEYGKSQFTDGCCVDCEFYQQGEELIGICTNEGNRQKIKSEVE